MYERNINENFLLLLVNNNKNIDTTEIDIVKHFKNESSLLHKLCNREKDNINEIILFIRKSLKSKIPNKIFNYCQELDKAYQSVIVNIDEAIKSFQNSREIIYLNQKSAQKDNKDYNIDDKISELKNWIYERTQLWFKAFDIEFAYKKADKYPNMLVHSHRISGWSKPKYRITDDLQQEVKTNFGYGNVSYFYSLLTYKNIKITPLSEWIDYRYSHFSEVIRYTKSFGTRIPIRDEKGKLIRYKVKIENKDWYSAIDFTKNAANLLINNEKEFVEKYIIRECETMVKGLEYIYHNDEFELIDEKELFDENKELSRYKLDIKGFELIDFKTEKIIGSLDFISKIIEYNTIIPTNEYTSRIITLNKKFIPNVHTALKNQKQKLKEVRIEYNTFLISHNELIERKKFFNMEKSLLKNGFDKKYKEKYTFFLESFNLSTEKQKKYKHRIRLYNNNIDRLKQFVTKYNEIVNNH